MLELYVRLQSLLTVQKEKGATAVEYGIMVALIAAVIVAIVATLGGQVAEGFQRVVDALTAGGVTP